MKILVTGGAGFIGSHLCDRLLAQGHKVVCLDNFYTGSRENVRHLTSNPDFDLVEHDIEQPFKVEVDQIYNLACPASPVHYQRDPVRTTRTCFVGAINMLELARLTNARILQASTSEVYGDPLEHPQTEKYNGNVNPVGPRSCYDEGKRVAESLFTDYNRAYGVDIRIARIFNTYGPRMQPNDGRVVSNFVVAALTNQPITIHGDGEQTRSFCHVSDTVEGLIRLMQLPKFHRPMNLGNPVEITVRELVALVRRYVNPIKVEYLPIVEDDPKRRKPDIEQARLWLGWTPAITIWDGLETVVEDFRERLLTDRAHRE